MSHDTDELTHFSQLSEQWWETQGPLRTLHDINPVRLDFILKHTSLKDKKVLDVGCGGGILSESLAKAGALVHGIDLEPKAIQVAQTHAQKRGFTIDYQCTDVESLLEKTERYDVIVCMEMLEHVLHPNQIVQTCAALLKPKGLLFLSTINRTWKAYGFAILGAEYLLDLVPKHTHHYERFIKPSEMAEWLREGKLSLVTLSGLDYNPWTHTASLTDDVSVNYLICAEAF